ncbi:MAG: MFS transporter [Sediminispirochaetaceae bacterium]
MNRKTVFPRGNSATPYVSPGRLSFVMLLFYLAAGAHIPIISLYLTKTLGFSGAQTGAILSMSALSALAAPLVGSFIADRLVSSERLLAYSQIISGCLMFVLTLQERFLPVLIIYLLYKMVFQPGVAVTNAIVFHHSPDSTRQFGGIRKWGTIGWILAGWFFSLFWLRIAGGAISDALYFTSLASIALGVYSFSLPLGRKDAPRRKRLFPRAALKLFATPAIAGTALAGFFIQLVDRYYYFGTGPFLQDTGFAEALIMPIMTIGQITEVIFLSLLGGILTKYGFRKTLMFGALMEAGRFFCFALVGWKYFAVVGILFHGPAFALFFSAAFIFIDSFTNEESRAGVQQIFSLVSIGLGNVAGSLLAGFMYDHFTGFEVAGEVAYTPFWLVPMGISVAVVVGFCLVRFREVKRDN